MHTFWTVRPNAGYGMTGTHPIDGQPITKNRRHNTPDLPEPVGERSWTMPGDLRVAEGAHNHLVHGSVLLPSTEAVGDETHWHWITPKDGGGIRQTYVGSGTPHTHTGELQGYPGESDYVQPKYYVLLITCDDDEYANLQANGVDVYAERPLTMDVWGAGKRNTIANRLHNALGLSLPDHIDTDKEFITWLLDFGGWRPEQEDKHQ